MARSRFKALFASNVVEARTFPNGSRALPSVRQPQFFRRAGIDAFFESLNFFFHQGCHSMLRQIDLWHAYSERSRDLRSSQFLDHPKIKYLVMLRLNAALYSFHRRIDQVLLPFLI